MGLDAYFYRRHLHLQKKILNQDDWLNMFTNASDHFKDLLNRMNCLAESWNYSLAEVISAAMQNFLETNENNNIDEIKYFRKFHFLNDYFNYTDDNYAKDMIITKEQCIYLRDKAKSCLDECNNVYNTVNYSTSLKACLNFSYEEERDKVCKIHFPSEADDSTYNKVVDLYGAMHDILNNTDWDTEYVVYNADW